MREYLLPSLWTNRSLSREVKVPAQTVSFSITVRELSIFADESGTEADTSGYYLLTLVLHDQSEDVTGPISDYESALRIRGLTDIPMHSSPLLRGNEDYENLDVALRLKYLFAFNAFALRLPIHYRSFVFERKTAPGLEALQTVLPEALRSFVRSNLEWLLGFDQVKIYYDGGQPTVEMALREVFTQALARQVSVFKPGGFREYRLAQVADYFCTIELTRLKFQTKSATHTDLLFFQSKRDFQGNTLTG